MLVPIIVHGFTDIETNIEFDLQKEQALIPRVGDEIIYEKNGYKYFSVVVGVRWLLDSPIGRTAVIYIQHPRRM